MNRERRYDGRPPEQDKHPEQDKISTARLVPFIRVEPIHPDDGAAQARPLPERGYRPSVIPIVLDGREQPQR